MIYHDNARNIHPERPRQRSAAYQAEMARLNALPRPWRVGDQTFYSYDEAQQTARWKSQFSQQVVEIVNTTAGTVEEIRVGVCAPTEAEVCAWMLAQAEQYGSVACELDLLAP